MQSADHRLYFLGILCFLSKSVVQEDITSLLLHVCNTNSTLVAHLDQVGVVLFSHCFNLSLGLLSKLSKLDEINLGQYDNEWLCLEQRLNVFEERDLLLNGVATSFRDVYEVEDASV